MPEQNESQLSPNKQDFKSLNPALNPSVSLTCDQINQIAQHYNRKNMRIYVQKYLPADITEIPDSQQTGRNAFHIMRQIQAQLRSGESAGYLHTEGITGKEIAHVECFIVRKDQIIKPIIWSLEANSARSVAVEHQDGTAATNSLNFSSVRFMPQGDAKSCASLSLAYLKQLLKDDAKQLKELTLCIPYFHRGNLQYFFVPSPQVLGYSQSTVYNQYIRALVISDSRGEYVHQGEKRILTPLKEVLVSAIDAAREQNWPEMEGYASRLLTELPAFRQRWIQEYNRMAAKHALMRKNTVNVGLAYTANRFQKIADQMQADIQNPGLDLLTSIPEKQKNLSQEDFKTFLFNAFSELKFNNTAQLAFVLNQLPNSVDGELIYPLLFEHQQHFALISKPRDYKDFVFTLKPSLRHQMHRFMNQAPQWQSLLEQACVKDMSSLLSWPDALGFGEQDYISFFQKKLPNPSFGLSLLNHLGSSDSLGELFKDKSLLTQFLNAFISTGMLKTTLPSLLRGKLANLKCLFAHQRDFETFLALRLPLRIAIDYLIEDEWRDIRLCNYLDCLDPKTRSLALLEVLQDQASPLMAKFRHQGKLSQNVLNLLGRYCVSNDLEDYLKTQRAWLLNDLITTKCHPTYPDSPLGTLLIRLNYLYPVNASEIRSYQQAFSDCAELEQQLFLRHSLSLLPLEKRWAFIDLIFGAKAETLSSTPAISAQIKHLLPERSTINKPTDRRTCFPFWAEPIAETPFSHMAGEEGVNPVALMPRREIKEYLAPITP